MDKVSTRPQAGATTPSRAPRVTPATAPRSAIEFDSSAADLISAHTERISGLANCAMCLTAIESAGGSFEGHILTSTALPSLHYVIMELAEQIEEAGHRLFAQYAEARKLANGEVTQ